MPRKEPAPKRLNKRQQRELEELEQLNALKQLEQKDVDSDEGEELEQVDADQSVDDDEEDVDVEVGSTPAAGGKVNPFDALDAPEDDSVDEEEEEEVTIAPVKSKKKPKKKKKKPSATSNPADESASASAGPSTPGLTGKKGKKGGSGARQETADDGMDEVDRALAELGIKPQQATGETANDGQAVAGGSMLDFRRLISVDPKNLDADAELRRFFGSKVITSSANNTRSHRGGPSSKLRYTISKPKPNYPPATSLAGLGMRELTEEEIQDVHVRQMTFWSDPAEKWFTFEHAGNWRETTRQFLGAVQSHDPNTLMALLQVFPWHVDTLLQMSEVYRLQSDIGAASDYAERALYALDRCLLPSFNVSSGACRLDFNRVENRPMFMACHRIISYLGRRGCWVTAFNFAKLLYALDPLIDPHGAAFWLDFLAVKSGNYEWILDAREKHADQIPMAAFEAYPGMAYAYALACRAREDAEKVKDRSRSDNALRKAMLGFPQVILPLADKLGISVPPGARSESLLQIEAGYSDSPLCLVHLLSHIYVSRSEALWKEADTQAWFQSALSANFSDMHLPEAVSYRDGVLSAVIDLLEREHRRDSVPLNICRHVLCSESTSFVGFLPPSITNAPFNAYDPLPPSTALSLYDRQYFSGAPISRRSRRPDAAYMARNLAGGGEGEGDEMRQLEFLEQVMGVVDAHPDDWREVLTRQWEGTILPGEQDEERRGMMVRLMLGVVEDMVQQRGAGGIIRADDETGGMPGAFPQ